MLGHTRRGISFFVLLPLKVLQPQCVGETRAPPGALCHSSHQLHPAAPRPHSRQSGSAGSRDLLRGNPHTYRCRAVPGAPTRGHLGMVTRIVSFYTILAQKNLTSVLDAHPPPRYLSIITYFLPLHLLFEKTLSKALSLKTNKPTNHESRLIIYKEKN